MSYAGCWISFWRQWPTTIKSGAPESKQLATALGIIVDKYTATAQNEQALQKLDALMDKVGGGDLMGFTPKQREFLDNANHRWNIKEGATRSGKTYLDYFVIPKRIRRVAGLPGLVVILGNTKGTLQRNIIEPLQDMYGAELVRRHPQRQHGYAVRRKGLLPGGR